MSHELRTPLNAIIGYTELMQETAEDSGNTDAVDDLGKIRIASQRLLALVDDVLDLARIEAGEVALDVGETNLRELIDGLVASVQPLAYTRGNELLVQYQLGYDTVRTDAAKTRQLLLNLLSNANKFTERGPVLVRVYESDDDPDDTYRVDVSDTGLGMTPEQVARVFLPFVQADASSTREYGGSGVGLTITKHLCEVMGGSIEVHTEPGEGSTFSVNLPRTVDASRPDTTTPAT